MHLRMNFGWIVLMIMVNNGVQAWTYHYNTNKKMEWEMARKWCRQHFTDMVAIQNKEEVKYLNQILPYHNSYYWIGLRKIAGQWTWVGTMKPLSPKAANWARNEPNDKGANEDCVEIYIKRPEDSGMWNDDKCSKEKTALCYTASCFERSCSEHAECVENIGNYTCKCNAGFTGPRCNEAVKCGMVKNPEHGFVQCNHVYGDFRFNSSCHFHCARGYIIQGSQNLHCLSSGKWDSDPPQCQVVECPPITTRTSGWNMTCRHPLHINSYNSTCVFSCEEGFELRGSKTTQCDHTGKWTHNTPTCTAVTCKPLVSPQKGNMTCTDPLGNFSYRSSCAVSCEEGYTLRGENTLACLETGKWSAETPSCEAVTCDPLVRPQRGHITCTDPLGNFLFSSLCAVICEEGYTLRGENTLTCLKNGNWSAETPSCEVLERGHNSKLACHPGEAIMMANMKEDIHQLVVAFNDCARNKLSDLPSAVLFRPLPIPHHPCYQPPLFPTQEKEVSVPSTQAFICQCKKARPAPLHSSYVPAVTCNPPVRPQKGNLTCKNPLGNFSFRSSCAVSCEEGYTLRGENTLTCLKTGKWSAETPSCEARQCPLLSSPEKGWMNCSHPHSPFSYGSHCSFGCEIGYMLREESQLDCTSAGTWNQETPSCQVVQCESLFPAPLSQSDTNPVPFINCSHPRGNFSFGSVCVFRCPEGYRLNGTTDLICTSTGLWTDLLPTCIIQSMTLGTGFLVYGAIGAASALGLLLMVGVVMLVMRQFSKDKFTPDYSAWDGALNPVFEANEPF
ncbi:E-selectin isoform X4 [Tachysurus ichikawai]